MYYIDQPYVNREIRRKVERYASKHNLSFIEAYNKLYKTDYAKNCFDESLDTSSRIGRCKASPTAVEEGNSY